MCVRRYTNAHDSPARFARFPNAHTRGIIAYLRDVSHIKNLLFALAGGYAVALFAWQLTHRAVLEDYILTNQAIGGTRPSFVWLALAALISAGLWLLSGYLRGRGGGDPIAWLDRASGGLLGLDAIAISAHPDAERAARTPSLAGDGA